MTSSKDDFEPFDWWVERLYRICLRHSTTSSVIFLIISTVFLTALVADDFGAVIRAAYDIKARPLQAIVLWTATAAIFILFLGRWALPFYLRHRSLYLRLARLYERQLSPILRPLSRDKVGWGMCLTLQPSPDLPEGWPMTEIEFERDPAQFVFPQGLQGQYEQYRREHFGNQEDRVRLMVTEVPSAYSDAPTLRLKIRHTLWSQVRFLHDPKHGYWTNHPVERDQELARIVGGEVRLPNSLCLHLVISTSDKKVLLTQSSKTVAYYAGAWACSIGEQIDPADFAAGTKEVGRRWVERALWEELAVESDQFALENARGLAVFLEGHIANVAIAAVARLEIDSTNLNAMLKAKPRKDYEFQDWTFVDWKVLPKEMLTPTREYHPSTGIRMLYGSLHRMGVAGLHRGLLKG